ncbi:unnamed protein product [Spirodela intermedia]|uniref:Uncharacterized protein n=1 Tax=Spirodela intermedia TaxID=51605 RepID=A0A7I8JCI8_SPIIN|nr:unnamed protein product [Spirodela intermedia]CAA6667867.1 unnamed protein product [Spirodela intermedia]
MLRSPSQLVPGNSGRLRSAQGNRPVSSAEPGDRQQRMSPSDGSATFVIGFMLMPWVIGMAMFLFFCGIVSYLSALGWSVLCPTPVFQRTPRKEVSVRIGTEIELLNHRSYTENLQP